MFLFLLVLPRFFESNFYTSIPPTGQGPVGGGVTSFVKELNGPYIYTARSGVLAPAVTEGIYRLSVRGRQPVLDNTEDVGEAAADGNVARTLPSPASGPL